MLLKDIARKVRGSTTTKCLNKSFFKGYKHIVYDLYDTIHLTDTVLSIACSIVTNYPIYKKKSREIKKEVSRVLGRNKHITAIERCGKQRGNRKTYITHFELHIRFKEQPLKEHLIFILSKVNEIFDRYDEDEIQYMFSDDDASDEQLLLD